MKRNVKFSIFTSEKLKKGYPIKMVIRKDTRRKVFSLNLFAELHQWDDKSERFNLDGRTKGLHPERIQNNAFLNRISTQAYDIIDDFEKNHVDWSVNQFQDRFVNLSKKGKIEPYFESVISTLKETKHIGNARSYEGALHVLQLFDKNFSARFFNEIDIKYVKAFDKWLQKPRDVTGKGGKVVQHGECAGNTRKYYIKSLRAILNMAIKDGEASTTSYPFGKGGFEIAKLEEETTKRYLPTTELQKLKDSIGQTDATEVARRFFLFSYYCFGISFIDMAMLTSKNLIKHEGGIYIVYKRQKTKNKKKVLPIQIRITDEIQSQLDWFVKNTTPLELYLLPIVSVSGYEGEGLYKHIRNRYKKYRASLFNLAVELEIHDITLTSYVSRHTMAMTLQGNNIPREVISQIMGHSDLSTTNVYLDSFGSSVIDEAAKVL